jgi:hypothetical protein
MHDANSEPELVANEPDDDCLAWLTVKEDRTYGQEETPEPTTDQQAERRTLAQKRASSEEDELS